jgi:hypothetical protein
MTLKLESHRDVQIYVDTLYSLARDARIAGDNAALKFIGGYLVNVVPPHLLEAFREELKRIEVAPKPALKLDDSKPSDPDDARATPKHAVDYGRKIATKVRQPVAATNW